MLIELDKSLTTIIPVNHLRHEVKEDEVEYVSMSDRLVEGSSYGESSSYEPIKMVLRKKNAPKQAAVLGVSGKLNIK